MLSRLAQLLKFSHRPGRLILVGCGVAIGLLLALVTTLLLVTGRQSDIADSERELRNLAFVLAEATDRAFSAADLMELDLVDAIHRQGITLPEVFASTMATAAAHDDLKRRIHGLQHVSSAAVTDLHGTFVTSTRAWPAPDINMGDRDIIQSLTRDPRQGAIISAPARNRTNGAWAILYGRAITAQDGRLLGFVTLSMELSSFEELFARIVVSKESTIALWRDDGILLARYPHQEAGIGRPYGSQPEFQRSMAARDRSVVHHNSIIDGSERLVAPHSVAQFPLMLAVTDTTHAVLTDWRATRFWMGGGTAVTEAVLAGVLILGVRRLRDQDRVNTARQAAIEAQAAQAVAESELARAQEREERDSQARVAARRVNAALANMGQGLLMFSPDSRLLMINPAFNELYGLPPDALRLGMGYGDVIASIGAHGNVPHDDLEKFAAQKGTLVDQRIEVGFLWDLSDGRRLAVTHQPMEDGGWVSTFQDITERRRLDEQMAYLAQHDTLTGLPNRAFFQDRLERALALVRSGQKLALLCLDLDQFKAVNDTLGHAVGDVLLQAVARRLQTHIRGTDTFARLGGDEFAIILAVTDRPAIAAVFADRVIDALHTPFDVDGQQIVIGTSIGIAYAPQDGTDTVTLLKNADLALYRAKNEGRGIYRLFHAAMDAELQARRRMEADLRKALAEGQLELHYQPLVAVRTRSVGGFEALLRWRHPDRGMVSPATFIPLAEETGLIIEIGGWVLLQACATAATWADDVRVSVNLSAVQFKSRDLVGDVACALRETGLAPERLELEITESVMLQETAATLETLNELHALGVRIAMDDFGTGYSSLSYLRRFPFDRIKIDQSFVRGLGKQRDSTAIIRAVLALGRELGVATTAEGVETREQLHALALAGCSDIQGFVFSPAVPAAEVSALLRRVPDWADMLEPALAA